MAERNVTRGYGLLERRLAKERAVMANRLIPALLRSGRLLDLGCGAYPYFLMHTDFREKFGLDNIAEKIEGSSISLTRYDLESETALPFGDNYFDVVTMLAVLEHIEPGRLASVLTEIRRVLKPGGLYLLTTPTPSTDKLLRLMAMLKLVSRHEIEDHKHAYHLDEIVTYLRQAEFQEAQVQRGYFELFMNQWIVAKKEEIVR